MGVSCVGSSNVPDRSRSISSTMLAGVKFRRREAWDRLVDVWGPVIYGWCRKHDVQPVDAEDIVQEAFSRLSRSLHRIRSRDKAAPYLRSIVLNLARDHNRRGLVSLRHQQSKYYERDLSSAEDQVVRDEDQQAVVDALRTLPTRQRDCVTLRYYLELPVAEVAETLGISPNSVKTHLRRGLAALESKLGGES